MSNCCDKNISFYYYGQDHFILNVYKFIKEQIEKNNYVFLYCDESLYNMIEKNLDENEATMVEKISFDKIMLNELYSSGNGNNMDSTLKDTKESVINKGFWGCNIILEGSLLIANSGKINFLQWLEKLSSICRETKFNILTCYDFEDYINRNKIIDEDIIRASYDLHEYRFFANKILPSGNFTINENLG